ncbi:permease prefix domain 1-containing protein [Peribacillus simplex]|uniref:Permease prefix domain 1-containing protein n=2 Tax=Peribacillus TaxID=2675229 RepID=A0AA90P700_9BACI|nr:MULTISPECIES: permease prefix domain 1-containing protein [Peribacillus]MDP1420514.1 permease prefix domain 1-containing protein [Peribacillus simplex]MDP1453361.1 permease prefix domain 1-containing protein [Peribacillus frigoritolerans]
MNQLEEYVHSVYRNVDGDKEEIEELKQEMRSHLLEAVYELKENGVSEEEANRIAIENFGDKKHLIKGLSEFFNVQKRFTRYILLFSLVSLVLGATFFVNTFSKINDFQEERNIIMNNVLTIIGDDSVITNSEKEGLHTIFDEHGDHLNYLAVFNVKEQAQVQEWLKEYDIKTKPSNTYPLEYQHATFMIGHQGENLNNKEEIVSSNYDLGTVASANDSWIVQYEYKDTYHNVIEANNSMVLGDYMDIFHLPILFFVVFGVLIIVWRFLKKYHKRYFKGLIN